MLLVDMLLAASTIKSKFSFHIDEIRINHSFFFKMRATVISIDLHSGYCTPTCGSCKVIAQGIMAAWFSRS